MATIYSNPLNLFNLTVKASPIGADLIPIGDSAVTGVPLKQATVSSIVSAAAGGSLVFLGSAVAATSATVDFAAVISSSYDHYLVTLEDYAPVSASQLWCRVGTGVGPTYQATNYFNTAAGTTAIDMTSGSTLMANNGAGAGGHAVIGNCNNATNWKNMVSLIGSKNNGATTMGCNAIAGQWQVNTVLTSLRFLASTSNMTTGTFKIYGIKNS